MNIGYIKLDKLNKFEKICRRFFGIIKVLNNTYYIPDTSEKIINRLVEKLKKDNIDYVISENGINIEYNKFDGKYLLKCALPEVIDFCFNALGRNTELEEIYICVKDFTKSNIDIIEFLTEKVKVVNVVTSRLKQFQELEKKLERKERYITVSNNKRKALKRAILIINLDCKNFEGFNVNRESIIINCNSTLELTRDFEGICIENIEIQVKKIMRIFSEMENMNKKELFEAELLKQNNYDESRYILEKSKMIITNIMGLRGSVDSEEFKKIKKMNEKAVEHQK